MRGGYELYFQCLPFAPYQGNAGFVDSVKV